MTDPTLIVMAAGLGSRYGGLKQMDPVGPSGEIILDYSAYDAVRAGFAKIVFVISRDLEDVFRERISSAIAGRVEVAYAVQELSDVPPGFSVPAGRTKPWGTGHAVLSCRNLVMTPFAVINADDYYGASAFEALAQHLRRAEDRDGVYDFCMVGYRIGNTLSESGAVARGVCEITADGYLVDVRERTRVRRGPEGVQYSDDGEHWITLPPDTIVSMNAWGFTPAMMRELDSRFRVFLERSAGNAGTAEYFLPDVVGDLVKEGKARVKVLPTTERWFGMTYKQDREAVRAAISKLVARNVYPSDLWGDSEG